MKNYTEKLLKVDYSIIEDVLGIALPKQGKKPKDKTKVLLGEPIEVFTNALFTTLVYIKNKKIYIGTYSIIIFILASLLSKNNYILFNILKYYNYSNLFFFILIPLIAFTAFSMKSSKKA